MNPDDLRTLIQVVESGSVQSAARHLGLTRSRVRRRLKRLEEVVGYPLLHAGRRRARLTASGAVLVEEGRRLLRVSDELLEGARAAATEAAGCVRIVEPVGLPLLPRCQALLLARASRPALRFELREVENPVAHLDDPVDIILHPGPPPERETWRTRVFERMQVGLLASPSYLAARGTPQSVTELKAHDTLAWSLLSGGPTNWPTRTGGVIELAPWLVSPNLGLLRLVAAGGGGILLAPKLPLSEERDTGPLVSVLENEIVGEEVMRLSTPNPSALDSRTRDILEQIDQVLMAAPNRVPA